MKDIRIDDQGRQRCWNCGGTNFTHKRTFRAKATAVGLGVATVGVGAAAAAAGTKKKLKCQSCGEYNDVGSAKPYDGPKNKRAAKKSGALELDKRELVSREKEDAVKQASLDASAATIAAATQPPLASSGDISSQLQQIAELHQGGVLDAQEFAAAKAKILGEAA